MTHRSFLDHNIRAVGFVGPKLATVVALKPVLPGFQHTVAIRAAGEQLEGVSLRNLGAGLPSAAVSSEEPDNLLPATLVCQFAQVPSLEVEVGTGKKAELAGGRILDSSCGNLGEGLLQALCCGFSGIPRRVTVQLWCQRCNATTH